MKDYIKNIIEKDLDGTIQFGRVNMKPGKPTTFATFRDSRSLFFALPGMFQSHDFSMGVSTSKYG